MMRLISLWRRTMSSTTRSRFCRERNVIGRRVDDAWMTSWRDRHCRRLSSRRWLPSRAALPPSRASAWQSPSRLRAFSAILFVCFETKPETEDTRFFRLFWLHFFLDGFSLMQVVALRGCHFIDGRLIEVDTSR